VVIKCFHNVKLFDVPNVIAQVYIINESIHRLHIRSAFFSSTIGHYMLHLRTAINSRAFGVTKIKIIIINRGPIPLTVVPKIKLLRRPGVIIAIIVTFIPFYCLWAEMIAIRFIIAIVDVLLGFQNNQSHASAYL
jgi:hypothetical protein